MTHSYGPGGLTTQEQGNNPALIGMVPAATSSRVVGRLVDSAIGILVIVVIPYAVSLGGLALFMNSMNDYSYGSSGMTTMMIGSVLSFALPVVYLGVEVYFWAKKGNHIGGYIVGLRNVDVVTGRLSTGQTIGKNLLFNITNSLTLGIMPLICCFAMISPGTNRNSYDRWLNLMVINTKAGRGPNAVTDTGQPTPARPVDQHRPPIQQVAMSGSRPHPTQAPVPPRPPIEPIAPLDTGSSRSVDSAPPAPIADSHAVQIPSSPVPPPPPPPSGVPYGDPFAAQEAPSGDPIVPVSRPGASSFIERTPLSGDRPPSVETAPPINARPAVVRDMSSVAAGLPDPPPPSADLSAGPIVEETVIDDVLMPTHLSSRGQAVTRLLLDGSTALTLDRITLLGRNPIDVPALGPTAIMQIDDDLQVSKTHLAVGVDGGGFWVMDLNSTNGTRVVAPDGTTTRVDPTVRTIVPAGAIVRFGSHSIKAER